MMVVQGMDTPEISAQIRSTLKPVRAKLIFNPAAGMTEESPFQLAEVIRLLQAWEIIPEVYMVMPDSQLSEVVRSAIRRGIRLIIISGGDGTIENAIGPMVGTNTTLGIIPTGTRNNIAISLGIPSEIPAAVALLRQGKKMRIDVGKAQCDQSSRWFIETSTLGLASALYPSADEIQHGNLARIADFFSTLVTSQPGTMRLIFDDQERVTAQGHLALLANMPYFGANFQLSPEISFRDGWLDLYVFSELTKLELMSYAVQITTGTPSSDTRILHYRVKHVTVETEPVMPVMADGFMLGEGSLVASIRPRGLNVISGLGRPIAEPADS